MTDRAYFIREIESARSPDGSKLTAIGVKLGTRLGMNRFARTPGTNTPKAPIRDVLRGLGIDDPHHLR